ncbi:PCRF domain-containing protein [Cobetia marina]|uniref:PCRF domain-containing protein n=1 Tax=Cobetia TaxID=204286 RepID=UPI0010AE7EC4|nr:MULTISPECIES: PCRF domain-containing protein [Cobetia]MDH2375407.1 hypothetical protein [Cobetia sp. 3AK]TKD64138.1 PCRF domain-containing protein [Cobetia marina]GED43910.1 hypothetical protein HHA02_32390 [Cobetia marina]
MSEGKAQTRLVAVGKDAPIGKSPLLFYAVGRNKLIKVPAENVVACMEEIRLLEAVVENYHAEIERLQGDLSNYEAMMMSYDEEDPECVRYKAEFEKNIASGQKKVDKANQALREILVSLSSLDDESNVIVELIPIRRNDGNAQSFRMCYMRSQVVDSLTSKIELKPIAQDGATSLADDVLEKGEIVWASIYSQLKEQAISKTLKTDFTWFDEWLKKDEDTIDLCKWTKELNKQLNLKYNSEADSKQQSRDGKVELSGEAQLARWTYGASGLTGELTPLEGKTRLKANAAAKLSLFEAKGSIDYYRPSGGLKLMYELDDKQVLQLGMLRVHAFISMSGAIGASIAAEINVDLEVAQGGIKARGTRGELVPMGPPGSQQSIILMEEDKNEQKAEATLEAFIGGKAEAFARMQLEWKSPEADHEFKPFAITGAGVAAYAGMNFAGNFSVSYQNGRFRIRAKAGICLGLGASGEVSYEVDTKLLREFAAWTYYQLKNADFVYLEFIDSDAFNALANIFTLAIAYGKDITEFMYETPELIKDELDLLVKDIVDDVNDISYVKDYKAASQRASVMKSIIDSDSDKLSILVPEAKSKILILLIKTDSYDKYVPVNRDYSLLVSEFTVFGSMSDRKEAIIKLLKYVQSLTEYKNIMQRIKSMDGDKGSWVEGERLILEFLATGEESYSYPISSNYPSELEEIKSRLKATTSKGTVVAKNDSVEYFEQPEYSSYLNIPCYNQTQCVVDVDEFGYV